MPLPPEILVGTGAGHGAYEASLRAIMMSKARAIGRVRDTRLGKVRVSATPGWKKKIVG